MSKETIKMLDAYILDLTEYSEDYSSTVNCKTVINELNKIKQSLIRESGEKWISVQDRSPESNDISCWHLINAKICDYEDEEFIVGEACYEGDGKWANGYNQDLNPTHWMPLPQPPNQSDS